MSKKFIKDTRNFDTMDNLIEVLTSHLRSFHGVRVIDGVVRELLNKDGVTHPYDFGIFYGDFTGFRDAYFQYHFYDTLSTEA